MSTSPGPGIRHTSVALAVAGAATVISLGLRVEGDQIGRMNTVRVFLVAAIALMVMAASSSSAPNRARTLVLGAIAMLGTTIALIVGNAAPQGLIVLLIALGALVYVRQQQRVTT